MEKKNQLQQKKRPVSSTFETLPDRVQPNAPELEMAVLGALLIESNTIHKVDLQVDDFYNPNNKTIFQAIESLARSRKPVDVLTVAQELNSTKKLTQAGGAAYIAELSDMVASAAHIEYHAAILRQKAIARKLINQSREVLQMSYDESQDVQDTIEYLERSFTEIRSGGAASEYLDMKSAIKRTIEYLTTIQSKKRQGEAVTIPTGLTALDDRLNGGWSAPDLIILGGRPSMGKTQFALHFAKVASEAEKHCLFISIEMTVEQLIMRMLTEDERLNLYDMKTGQLGRDEWICIDENIRGIENNTLFIADNYHIRYLNNIKSLARKLHRTDQLDLLIIDYLQLIKTNQSFGTRDLEIGYITGELKSLAKELNTPVILLAQLSRPPKGTTIQIPVLSDLRESGNIEQDADKVIFPHRPSYYEPEATESNGRSWKNRGVLIIGKDREGAKDKKVYFQTDDRFKKIWDENHITQEATETTPF
ncbi:replicative DNA helicase [Petrimonas sulfuriphila]|uniref:replicative DNA helicase n=1 Tax=Petrimonas sulfuriphila TaxID=285070 RepID=UPI003EBBC309